MDDGCPILEKFMDSLPQELKDGTRKDITNLTFRCTKLKWREVEERFIKALKESGLFRAALIYQEERFRLLLKPEAYDEEGNLIPKIVDIFNEFNWLGRVRQVTIIDHTDSERDFRKEEMRENHPCIFGTVSLRLCPGHEPGLIITKVIHDQSYVRGED